MRILLLSIAVVLLGISLLSTQVFVIPEMRNRIIALEPAGQARTIVDTDTSTIWEGRANINGRWYRYHSDGHFTCWDEIKPVPIVDTITTAQRDALVDRMIKLIRSPNPHPFCPQIGDTVWGIELGCLDRGWITGYESACDAIWINNGYYGSLIKRGEIFPDSLSAVKYLNGKMCGGGK